MYTVYINFTKDMRYHLTKCFLNNKFSAFPTNKVNKSNRIIHELDEIVYCTCRGIDTGKQMVGCDKCSKWFHIECVGDVSSEQWFCVNCK